MRRCVTCRIATLLFAFALTGVALPSAQACMWNEAYEPNKPFYESYFVGAKAIFRGSAIEYRYPERDRSDSTAFDDRVEITFRVTTTYQGEERDIWKTVWVTTAFPKPVDLLAFKQEIGDDLIVVLDGGSDVVAVQFGGLPFVAHRNCGQPGMRSYEVMESVLRERGFIQ